jgi:hypothetical protein
MVLTLTHSATKLQKFLPPPLVFSAFKFDGEYRGFVTLSRCNAKKRQFPSAFNQLNKTVL